jgi:hypothetical protein
MADDKRKIETIRRIENLLLDRHFVQALEDHHSAQAIIDAINSLERLSQEWN